MTLSTISGTRGDGPSLTEEHPLWALAIGITALALGLYFGRRFLRHRRSMEDGPWGRLEPVRLGGLAGFLIVFGVVVVIASVVGAS